MIFKLNFCNELNVQNYTQEIKETLISVIYLNIYLYIATMFSSTSLTSLNRTQFFPICDHCSQQC